MRAVISTTDLDPETCVARARSILSMAGLNLADGVSTRVPYRWQDDGPSLLDPQKEPLDNRIWPSQGQRLRVAAFDFGIKYNILRNLTAAGCDVVVVPASTDAGTIRAMAPDGVFLSNGPGDPEPVTGAIATIRELIGYRPIFGICLGHQLMGLALEGKTFKLKFGHRGANQPVKDLQTGRVEITSQNHGFAVDTESMQNDDIEITHINLNDNTLEGFRHRKLPIFTVQYHPEAAPGPHDAGYLFQRFTELMKRA
jgi:carbamoyl-phosphate synthase small subunit